MIMSDGTLAVRKSMTAEDYRLARATAALSRRFAPGTERTSSMSSFTLWLMPSWHGVKIIAVGAMVATASASWPAWLRIPKAQADRAVGPLMSLNPAMQS